jgi:hypothetical protein
MLTEWLPLSKEGGSFFAAFGLSSVLTHFLELVADCSPHSLRSHSAQPEKRNSPGTEGELSGGQEKLAWAMSWRIS